MSEEAPARRRGRLPACENLTVNQAAALIGLHPETVRRLVKDRRLGHHRIGCKILIPRSVIKSYLEETYLPPIPSKTGAKNEKGRS